MERAYVAYHVTPERLRNALRAVSALGILGVNLTVPHKERAFRMMAHLSDEARKLGAVNCIVNREGVLYGDNTDARGLEADLRDLGIALEGRTAVVVGAGGAAASVILAAIRLGARRIVLCNRTPARAKRLARRFTRRTDTSRDQHVMPAIEVRDLEALTDPSIMGSATLVTNATPMGLKTGGFANLAYEATPQDCSFYDLIYAREATPFLAPAAALSRRAFDGAGMLVNQGVLAFELFNDVKAPSGEMRRALMEALGRV